MCVHVDVCSCIAPRVVRLYLSWCAVAAATVRAKAFVSVARRKRIKNYPDSSLSFPEFVTSFPRDP